MPDLGEGLVEAEIVRWLVSEGQFVEVDAPLVEVETAKSVVELPSPHRGLVSRLHGGVGDSVAVGAPLVTLLPDGTATATLPSGGTATRPSGPSLVAVEAAPAVAAAPPASGRRTPLYGPRGAVVRKVETSRREIPHVTVWVDADATGLLAARRRAAAAARPGLLGLLAWFALDGLRRFPVLNGRVDPERQEIVEAAEVNLGLVVQGERGLVIPVLPAAQALGPDALVAGVRRVVESARTGGGGYRVSGGTFTVNNFGGFGVDGSTPIINHPEVAMLGMGRLTDRPWVVDGGVRPRAVTQLSLTFDHRVCDGDVAGGFLRHVADLVERGALPSDDAPGA
ncbi:dihydrolipoamide acetyltransferase family protein [Sphaerisporangium sp. TRM90804]|nr:dihydrolipoamide acetyltransferase family protein [Sphaerisporangium sp. TRM90804]MDH2423785.1 dihydrolipoamide acetyltransferase family protein [Sphaerisporangium sp. TRM90804]